METLKLIITFYITIKICTWPIKFLAIIIAYTIFYIKEYKENNKKIVNRPIELNYYKKIGKKWEERLTKIIKYEIGESCRILNNLYIPRYNGYTTEIDILLIDDTGLYCIECKNYQGWIFGKKTEKYWMQTFPNGERYRFYNPYLQNKSHVKYLQNIITNAPIYNIVVFSNKCDLKNLTLDENITQEYQFKNLLKWYREHPKILNNNQIDQIYTYLLRFKNVNDEVKQKHIENIKK